MKIDTFRTRTECDQGIEALERRKKDLEGTREFVFDGDYCIGGPTEPFSLTEPEALAHLRNELALAGVQRSELDTLSWEELASRWGWKLDKGAYRFNVTREGCRPSTLFVAVSPS